MVSSIMSLHTSKRIRLSKSCLSPAEKQAVMGVLDREYLGMGDDVRQFESALSSVLGRPTACVVNGTAALQLAIQACGIGNGDEVLVPSLTYVASFQAISATGAKPIPCDIEEDSCILDTQDAERRLSPRTKAVMPVHYTGGVGDLAGIYDFAGRRGLRVVEDASHAFGTRYKGQTVGSFGDIACFSFDGIKNFTSGEGGCIVTSDSSVLGKIQDLRLLGVEKDTDKRYSGQRSWEFDVQGQGWRYHMSNIMAAIGLKQLERFPALAARRQHLARLYDDAFLGNSAIQPLRRNHLEVVPHIYVVRLRGATMRDSVRAKLLEAGIETGIHYQPNHTLSFYRDPGALPLPVTENVFPELLSLPLHPDLSENDVLFVCERLRDYAS
jgi:dTDP-4-amino-4,6-dideoxygalactose transaminase